MKGHPVIRPVLSVLAHLAVCVVIAVMGWDVLTVRLRRTWADPHGGTAKITMLIQLLLFVALLVVLAVVDLAGLLRWFRARKRNKGPESGV